MVNLMYDVIIIGGGPGGYKCAELLGKQKQRVAIIEEGNFGGVCLNQGCIPFKAYLYSSKLRDEAQKAIPKGLLQGEIQSPSQSEICRYKDYVVKKLCSSVESLLKYSNVEILRGHGSIKEYKGNTIVVDVNGQTYETFNLVIATGSEEKKLQETFVSSKLIDSKTMLELDYIPETIDIIGGGAVGLEAACFYAEAGSRVKIIEAMDHIGGQLDIEMADAIEFILKKKAVTVLTDTKVETINENGLTYSYMGDIFHDDPQLILVAIGRTPTLDIQSLLKCGIEYSKNGICINSKCRTNKSNIYSCGDATGMLMLAHTAYRQARVITDNIAGRDNEIIDYSSIPRVIYTNPEILSIGLTEEECKEYCIEYCAKSLPMSYSGKYFVEKGKDGAKVKMIVNKKKQIIGFHAIGNGASEFSLAAEIMIQEKMTVQQISNFVFAHPTYFEIVGELADQFQE